MGPLERSAEEKMMPTMSNTARKRIQAKQRKVANAAKRAAKLAKKNRNNAK